MSDRVNSVVMGALMILLLVNLIFPVVYHFVKPAPVEAATNANYTETWNAAKVMITNTTQSYQGNGGRRCCRWWCWWWYWQGDSSYIEVTPGNISSYWSGRSYWYYWNLSPHGLVTEWTVAGTLTKQ